MHKFIGIDIGKTQLDIVFPPPPSVGSPKPDRFPHMVLYFKNANWWQRLIELIAPDAVVCAESTGHYLLVPLASLLEKYRPDAQLWQVDARVTRRYREAFISIVKTDKLDAAALCLIAVDIAANRAPRSVRPYDYWHESAVQRLRIATNRYHRLVRDRVRALNRLNIMSHALYPGFVKSPTWERAARLGYITCNQITALTTHVREQPKSIDAYMHGTARNALYGLSEGLPAIDGDPEIIAAIPEHFAAVDALSDQIAHADGELARILSQPPFDIVARRWGTLYGQNNFRIAALQVAARGRILEMTQDDFVAAVGTNPIRRQSGTKDAGRMSRAGYRPGRSVIHVWAFTLLSPYAPDNPTRRYRTKPDGTTRPFAQVRTKLARVLWGMARDPRLDDIEATAPDLNGGAGEDGE